MALRVAFDNKGRTTVWTGYQPSVTLHNKSIAKM